MSALEGRDPTEEELAQMNKKEKKERKKRTPQGTYATAIKNWYFETTKLRKVFDVTEERSGDSLFNGLSRAVRILKLEGKVKVYAFKKRDKDRVYLKRLK
jgi:hypothetical protein